ncbi:MAG: MBL fold metallo-hydrolase [Burkholderiales bacterium]|nr:MBL fold metallo-hydrolase [Burkholderiales bacterium]
MATWVLGDVRVSRIEETLGEASYPPAEYFSEFDPAVIERHRGWLVPEHYVPARNALITSVHSWLIRTPRHTILLDACAGNHKQRQWWPRFHLQTTPFLERLRAAGAAPGDIDIVMCTHLHADHIGWNTVLRDGRWVPTFPRAKYLMSRQECEFWDPRGKPAELAEDPGRRVAFPDSVLPVLEAGQAQLLEGAHAIDDTLQVEPAPGHTPGHMILRLVTRQGAGGVFSGDALHHPLQVYLPHWNSRFCAMPEEARATRRRLLEHCAERGAWLFPTHFGAPHVAAIEARADAFAAQWITAST